jgi:aminobenzoyl-glutamate transport protein
VPETINPSAIKPAPPSNSFLDWVERTGNRLPDPALHFLFALLITWVFSALLAGVSFTEIDPRSGQPIQIHSQITGEALAQFLARMVSSYAGFPPLGVVLVMVIGVGVAEHSGLFAAGLQRLLDLTPKALLSPALAFAAIVSHVVADASIVALVPLGGALFYAAGRHPLSGVMLSFAGVVGAFAVNVLPTGLDPLLQGFTQGAAQILNPDRTVNPLCNLYYMMFVTPPIVLVSWWVTDRIVEPRLRGVPVDGDPADLPEVKPLGDRERRALWLAAAGTLLLAALFVVWLWPSDSALRDPAGNITGSQSPLMLAIVPVMLLFTTLPGLIYGYAAGTFQSHKDVIKGISKAMSSMGYYLVLVFFAAIFIYSFSTSNLGALLALKGGTILKDLALPPMVTVFGVILLTGCINLVVGSASAKWAMLAPIFVPMLMTAGISPELTQLAFRVGDGPSNIVTPLLPYFPLLIAYSVRYVKSAGVGTAISLLMPYTAAYYVVTIAGLALYWWLGLPLGVEGVYTYP